MPVCASGIAYTCNANVSASVCTTLNSTISGLYNSTFANANANVYIQYGNTGLASSSQNLNTVSYTDYRSALASHASGANDATAISTLSTTTNPVVAGDAVLITSALESALFSGSNPAGLTAAGTGCTLNGFNSGCYNGIVTVSNSIGFYYRSGAQSGSSYDFYSAVQHETDEILGTISCISICGSNVAPTDLFRFSAPGTRTFGDAGTAFFSINNGTTNIASYNNSANGADYGDWNGEAIRVQNAYGTPGAGNIDITNDGRSEIAVLDAVGFNLINATAAPEPGTNLLIASALAIAGAIARKRRVR